MLPRLGYLALARRPEQQERVGRPATPAPPAVEPAMFLRLGAFAGCGTLLAAVVLWIAG